MQVVIFPVYSPYMFFSIESSSIIDIITMLNFLWLFVWNFAWLCKHRRNLVVSSFLLSGLIVMSYLYMVKDRLSCLSCSSLLSSAIGFIWTFGLLRLAAACKCPTDSVWSSNHDLMRCYHIKRFSGNEAFFFYQRMMNKCECVAC